MPSNEQYIEEALKHYTSFLNHAHAAGNELHTVKLEDYEKNGSSPWVAHTYNHRDWAFGYLVIIGGVDPYQEEGGPADLICLFACDPETGLPYGKDIPDEGDEIQLKWMAQNFDTITTEIYSEGQLRLP